MLGVSAGDVVVVEYVKLVVVAFLGTELGHPVGQWVVVGSCVEVMLDWVVKVVVVSVLFVFVSLFL